MSCTSQRRRGGRCVFGRDSSAGDSRAASTACGFRTRPVFAPAKAASVRGVQPAFSAVVTAGGRAWPAGRPSAAARAPTRRRTHQQVCHRRGFPGWFLVRFVCNRCTPRLRWLHPARVLVAPRSQRGVQLLHPAGPVQLSTASLSVATGCGGCIPSPWPSAPGCAAAASLAPSLGNWCSSTARAAPSRS